MEYVHGIFGEPVIITENEPAPWCAVTLISKKIYFCRWAPSQLEPGANVYIDCLNALNYFRLEVGTVGYNLGYRV